MPHHPVPQGYEYVAIFDADFDPPADFLEETIPLLAAQQGLGFVQTRWCFTNTDTFLTWAQVGGQGGGRRYGQPAAHNHRVVGGALAGMAGGTPGLRARRAVYMAGGGAVH